jgi:putative transposase
MGRFERPRTLKPPALPGDIYGERSRGFIGQHFWARGYFVSTVGRDERVIRDYIKNQEKEDQRLDQLNLWR